MIFLSAESLSSPEILKKKTPLLIGIHADGQEHFELFLAGRDPLKIKSFSGKYAFRDIVEQVLLLQALDKGGYKANIQLVHVNFYKRRIRLIEQGEVHLSATPLWLMDLTEAKNIFVTPALIKEGEFTAGLYIHAEKDTLLENQTLQQIRELHAVSNRNWSIDWQVLTEMDLAGLNHSGQFPLMALMLVKGRADFMMSAFYNSPDLSFIQGGEKFIPIPNVKIALPGSRHFALSDKHPDFEEIKQALIKGLAILTNEGTIQKAYTQCGFFNDKVKNWQVINE